MEIQDIAKVAHQVNKAYCESQGDFSLVDWEASPEWQRESAINGVLFHQEKPDATPRDFHNEWMIIKKAQGWKWGPVKNIDKKEHPCFMPYEQLPLEQQAKDFIFRAIAHSLLPFLDKE